MPKSASACAIKWVTALLAMEVEHLMLANIVEAVVILAVLVLAIRFFVKRG
jgi:hypothetical protein